MEPKFEEGQIVEHRLSKEWVMVLEESSSGVYLCRTKSFDKIEFFKFELVERRK